MPSGLTSSKLYDYKTLLIDAVFTERSLVREIGSRLPLQESKRPYFYVRMTFLCHHYIFHIYILILFD